MCGDTHCPSCGPAQGNWQCPICGAWADDGRARVEERGDVKPEHLAEATEKAEAEAEAERPADDAYALELERMDKLWKERE
jgi:uncharacterized Zn finger protein (UPF0148 family)